MPSQYKLTYEAIATAAYIAELSMTLARLAQDHNLETLRHLLEMARLEAEQFTNSPEALGLMLRRDRDEATG